MFFYPYVSQTMKDTRLCEHIIERMFVQILIKKHDIYVCVLLSEMLKLSENLRAHILCCVHVSLSLSVCCSDR